jgi:hypothetical protein
MRQTDAFRSGSSFLNSEFSVRSGAAALIRYGRKMKLRVFVDPKFCGPVSVGTVDLIKIVRKRCNFGLTEAKRYIDDAVFGGEIVDIPLPEETDGLSLVEEIRALDTPAKIVVELVDHPDASARD